MLRRETSVPLPSTIDMIGRLEIIACSITRSPTRKAGTPTHRAKIRRNHGGYGSP